MAKSSLYPEEARRSLYNLGLIDDVEDSIGIDNDKKNNSIKVGEQGFVESLFGKKIIIRVNTIFEAMSKGRITFPIVSKFINAQGVLSEETQNYVLESATASCTVEDIDVVGFIKETKVNGYNPEKDVLDICEIRIYTSLNFFMGLAVNYIVVIDDALYLACYVKNNSQDKRNENNEDDEREDENDVLEQECPLEYLLITDYSIV